MNPNVSNMNTHEPDDLDRRFSAFFKAQAPKTWPAPLAPVAQPTAPQRKVRSQGRFTLAMSVALLLGVGFYLTSGMESPTRPDVKSGSGVDVKEASANGAKLLQPTPMPPEPIRMP